MQNLVCLDLHKYDNKLSMFTHIIAKATYDTFLFLFEIIFLIPLRAVQSYRDVQMYTNVY